MSNLCNHPASMGASHRRLLPALALFGLVGSACDIVYLFPQENRKNSIDVDVTDTNTNTSTSLNLTDREGYFAAGNGYYQFSWPSTDEYGTAGEYAYIYFLPLFHGRQTLGGGYIQTADGNFSLLGQEVDFEVEWKGSRRFPFVHKGTFTGEPVGGVTVEGEFTLSNMNCLADTFDYDSEYECGRGFLAGGSYDVTWSLHPEYQWCPSSVVDAFVGSSMEGSVSENKLEIGDIKLDCVDGYNNRYLCGQDPVTIEADGCTYEVLGRGGPAGYDPSVVTGWFVMSAATTCSSAPYALCETWFEGTPIE